MMIWPYSTGGIRDIAPTEIKTLLFDTKILSTGFTAVPKAKAAFLSLHTEVAWGKGEER